MGCGSSSLKGDKVDGVNSKPTEAPMRRVQTNFSDIDFTGEQNPNKRRNTEYVAPDEARRPTKISENVAGEDNISPQQTRTQVTAATGTTEGLGGIEAVPNSHKDQGEHTTLEPYKPIAGESDDLSSPVSPKKTKREEDFSPLPEEQDPTYQQQAKKSKDHVIEEQQPSSSLGTEIDDGRGNKSLFNHSKQEVIA